MSTVVTDDKYHALEAKYKALKFKYDDLIEVVTPFVFHGKALGARERTDVATPISQEGSSYLCLGAFQILMDTLAPDHLRLKGMCGWCGTPEATMGVGFKICSTCHPFVVCLTEETRQLIRTHVSAVRRRAMVEKWNADRIIKPGSAKARRAAKPFLKKSKRRK